MRLQDLAVRLVAVEAKLATLTGTAVDTDNATSIEELDARLSVVEAQIEHLIVEKTQRQIDAIVYSPADEAPVEVEDVVALSPSFEVSEAAAIVTDVVAEQHEAAAIINPEVADVVTAAVVAVVSAEPEVVLDPVALTEAIIAAVADAPLPAKVGNSIANQNICAPGNDVVWLYAGNMSPAQWEDTLLINSGYTWSAPEAEVTSGIVTSGANHDGIYWIGIADASGTAVAPSSGKVYTFFPSESAPAPAPEVVQQIVDAVVDIIATATGVDTVAPEVVQQIVEAVSTPADSALDAINARLDVAESKVDSLLGK